MKFTILTTCVCLLLLPVFTQTAKTSKPEAKKAAAKPTPAKSATKKTSDSKTASAKNPASKNSTSAAKKTSADKTKIVAKKDAETKTASAKPKSTGASSNKPKPKPKLPVEKTLDDKAEFEKAAANEDSIEKINSLRKFLADFPDSKLRPQAQGMLAVTAATVADEKFKASDNETALALYKLAAESAPKPIPDKLFTDALSKIPNTLYWRGNRTEALEIAKTIESKIDANAAQLNTLTNFYIGIEDGEDAVRVAEKAVQLDPASTNSQMTLGLAYRVNFQLAESAAAFAKAVEIDGESINARRSLADMKRSLGKPDEAITLYREILSTDDANIPARTGLILSLFDAGKRADAESEMAKSLEQNPSNVILLAGAAYWYAANNEGEKAIETAQKAISLDPRYIWSHIALAHGYINRKRPLEAEEALLRARAYGNFPTLEYEIASARLTAGFYREAAEELSKSFSVIDGSVQTKLGGRVNKQEKDLTDLLAYERKASILEPIAADDAETAARLKSLLEFTQKMSGVKVEEGEAILAADAFAAGDDKMKLHRELYAASVLLEKKIALGKVLDYTKSAIGKADASLDVPSAGSAVMASELYDSRTTALKRNEFIHVPEVPRQTLLAILRGRIEEIAGRALYNQNNPAEAVIRLRRAVSVMPDKSAWWRSSVWYLGAALQADGKEKEALDTYIRSYKIDKPDMVRYSTIEALYKKLNGGTEGLEAKIGPSPLQAIAASVAQITETAPTPEVKSEPTPESSPVKEEVKSQPTPEPSPATVKTEAPPEVKTEPTTQPPPVILKEGPKAEPTPAISPSPTPAIESTPTPAITEPTPQSTPETTVEPTPTPQNTVEPTPTPTPEIISAEKTVVAAPETKPTPESSKPAETKRELFEPIIITIPRSGKPKDAQVAKIESKPTPADPSVTEKTKMDKTPTDEKKSGELAPGDTRARVVVGKEIQAVEVPKCSITATQESLSVINDGGRIGILIGLEGEGDIKSIKAISSSPEDVEATLEPAGIDNQAFFVVKSISKKTGLFQLTFELPCGKKEVTVTVR